MCIDIIVASKPAATSAAPVVSEEPKASSTPSPKRNSISDPANDLDEDDEDIESDEGKRNE